MRRNSFIKKKILFLFILVLCFFMMTGFTYQEDKQRIFDNAGLLTEEDEEYLEDLYREYSLKDEMDYILLTTNTTDGMEPREYAKQFYIQQGIGYDKENGDGNLLLIDMEHRRAEMIDRGICVDYITDGEVEGILEVVKSDLSGGDYARAGETYADAVHDCFGASGSTDGFLLVIYGVIAIVAAGILTGVLISGNKSAMTADCHTYSKKVRVNPATRKDRYLRTVTTARPKPKENSDGGGGSVDSSGFGGGGTDF